MKRVVISLLLASAVIGASAALAFGGSSGPPPELRKITDRPPPGLSQPTDAGTQVTKIGNCGDTSAYGPDQGWVCVEPTE